MIKKILFFALSFWVSFASPAWGTNLGLDGAFLEPYKNLSKPSRELRLTLKSAKESNLELLIIPWTLQNSKTIYPSTRFEQLEDIPSGDLLRVILEEADKQDIGILLGLNACRSPEEGWNAEIRPEIKRNQILAEELQNLYGRHPSFKGFYINLQFAQPDDDKIHQLIRGIVEFCHQQDKTRSVTMSIECQGEPLRENIRPKLTSPDGVDEQYREEWASSWVELLKGTGIGAVLVKAGVGTGRHTLEKAVQNHLAFKEESENQQSPYKIWAQVELFDMLTRQGRIQPDCNAPEQATLLNRIKVFSPHTDKLIGYSFDYIYERKGKIKFVPAKETKDELFQKAEAVDEHIRSFCMRDGQLVTVRSGMQFADELGNLWQEDACWLTGLYTSALSFRSAVTRTDRDRKLARLAWLELHKLANTTPLKGEVVRNSTRYLYTQLTPVAPRAETIKRWHKYPGKELYWVGDISIDQLSGYFHGVATYYDLVASEQEKKIIRDDVQSIMTLILENGLKAREYNGLLTTFGNLRPAPELALTFLKIAYQITGDEKFQKKYLELINKESMDIKLIETYYLMHYIVKKYRGQHFLDTAFYHLLMYEEDPVIYRSLLRGLDCVHEGCLNFGNAYAEFTYRVHNPDSTAGLRAEAELIGFNRANLENGYWFNKVNRRFRKGEYVPIQVRPGKEFAWQWSPAGLTRPRGTPDHLYAGIGYLLVYWGGRYHGFIH